MKNFVTSMAVVGIALAAILSAVWSGYVLTVLWGWFIVPFGLPALSISWAFGLILVVSLLRSPARKPREDETWHVLACYTLGPLFALLFGWIAHSFMVN